MIAAAPHSLAGALLGLLLLAAPALAQGGPPAPTQQQIEDALAPPWWRGRAPGARSWSAPAQPPAGARGVVVEGEEALGLRPAIDLHVPFAFDSMTLTAEGQEILATLARALQHPRLVNARLRIVGHTDGRGTEDYNQTLSERRAAAVREYLMREFRVNPLRLEAMGKGKRELLDPANPNADVNRRVQVINVGD